MRFPILVGVVLALLPATFVSAQRPYTFTSLINEQATTHSPKDVALNDSGSVVVTDQDQNGNVINVFGAGARSVAASGPQSSAQFASVGYPSINSTGQVAYVGYSWATGSIKLQLDTLGVQTTIHQFASSDIFGNGVSLNDNAVAAYRYEQGNGTTRIVRSDGITIATVGKDGITDVLDPSMNNSGVAAFNGSRNGVHGIFIGDGLSPPATMAQVNGTLVSIRGTQSINNNGIVSFSGTLSSGGQALYVGDVNSITQLFHTTLPSTSILLTSINDAGTVAFGGTLDDGRTGVFTIPLVGGTPSEVVGVGDPLFGSTVTGVTLYERGLNDGGQMAIVYELANQTTGVLLATPVPEPTTSASSLALVAFALCRRRSPL